MQQDSRTGQELLGQYDLRQIENGRLESGREVDWKGKEQKRGADGAESRGRTEGGRQPPAPPVVCGCSGDTLRVRYPHVTPEGGDWWVSAGREMGHERGVSRAPL